MSEGDDLAIIDGSGINATSMKLVNECLIVEGSHRGIAIFEQPLFESVS